MTYREPELITREEITSLCDSALSFINEKSSEDQIFVSVSDYARFLEVRDAQGQHILSEKALRKQVIKQRKPSEKDLPRVLLAIAEGLEEGRANPRRIALTPSVPRNLTARTEAIAEERARLEIRDEAQRQHRRLQAGDREPLRSRLLGVEELADMPRPEPLIEGVLSRDTSNMLAGPSGVGKSAIALDWALCVASGRSWMGRAVVQGRVLYIAAEGATGVGARVDAWTTGWQTDVPADGFRLLPEAVDLSDESTVDELVDLVEVEAFDLVILDTLARVSGGAEENSATAMGGIINALERLRTAHPGACIVTVHHTGKAADSGPRGSSAIYAAMNTVVTASGDSSSIKLEASKQKDGVEGHLEHLMLRPVNDSIVVSRRTGEGATAEAEALAPKVDEALKLFTSAFSAVGATRSEFRTFLTEHGFPHATAYRSINALVTAGRLTVDRSRLNLAAPPSNVLPL